MNAKPLIASRLRAVAPEDGVISLTTYPYYLRLERAAVDGAPDQLIALASALASDGGDARATDPSRAISFTEVRVDPGEAARGGGATFFSRTHAALAPHTDSSYADAPHELVAFQCVKAAESGGETIMIPIDDVLRLLDANTIAVLRRSYPFGDGDHPIIDGPLCSATIRYYRAQLDESAARRDVALDADQAQALTRLDAAIASAAREGAHRFTLRPGDILLMNNLRVLHARTGFAADSARLFYRVRERVSALDPGGCADAFARAVQPPSDIAETARQLRRSARTALSQARFDDAEAAARDALSVSPDDPRTLELLGEVLTAAGRFDAALDVYGRAHALAPSADEAGFAYAALLRDADRDAEAEIVDRAVLSRNMVARPSVVRAERPTILWTRAFDKSRYAVTRRYDGAYEAIMRRGHFALTHLLKDDAVNWSVLNVFEDNIDEMRSPPVFDVLVNTISCPDLERRALLALARLCDRMPEAPVINHPRRVLRTARDENAMRLGDLRGVVFPRTLRLKLGDEDRAATARALLGYGFHFPFIVREVGTQTGRSVELIDTMDALIRVLADARAGVDYYVSQYVCCRRADGLFPKSRVFFVDGVLYPVASLAHNGWSVHSGDRYSVMADAPRLQDAERAYLNDFAGAIGEENVNRLYQISKIIDLDFFGVDFTILSDGSLLVFEANPAMRHNYDYVDAFPYTRPALDAVSDAFDAMVRRRSTGG